VVEELSPLLGDNHDLHGLDYGCGPGPTLSVMLREKGFKMADYDPFFKPMPLIDDMKIEHHDNDQTNTTTTDVSTSNTNHDDVSKKQKGGYDPEIFQDDYFVPPFDFITCTETAEHFTKPGVDFQKLLSPLLLRQSGGILVIMTQMLYSKEQFVNWWYLRDKTHVSFYSPETMEFIAKKNNLRLSLPNIKNIAIFTKEKRE